MLFIFKLNEIFLQGLNRSEGYKEENDEARPNTESARVDENAEVSNRSTISPTCRLKTILNTRRLSLSKLQNNQRRIPTKKVAAIIAAPKLFPHF